MATPDLYGGTLTSDRPRARHPYPPALATGNDRRSRHSKSRPPFHIVKKNLVLEQRRLEQELALAASIQARLFPAVLPELVDCQLAAQNRPAFLCGGDYYDVLPMTEAGERGTHLLCVADVSGKGLAASLLMSNLQAILRTSLGYRPELIHLVLRASSLLYAATPPDRYITAILAYFEPVTGRCTFVNAGHNGGLWIHSDGNIDILKTTGPPLGLLRDLPFFSHSIELSPGDILHLYSDGVPETFNHQDEEWGNDRLMHCLNRCRHLSPAQIVSRVFEEIDAFAGDAPQHDDITMLVVKRRS